MDARLYVYAYLLLSALYAAGCLQYVNALGRTGSIAKGYRTMRGDVETLSLDSEDVRDATVAAVRSVLGVDSAAFACAVLPVAYVAVTGLLGNLISRNTSTAAALNPVWLLITVALVVGHMVFLVRVVGLNSRLRDAGSARLSSSFVSRHVSMLTYYRGFVLAVTLFNVVNTLYVLATIQNVTSLPYVGF
jgi:hypothetical protein